MTMTAPTPTRRARRKLATLPLPGTPPRDTARAREELAKLRSEGTDFLEAVLDLTQPAAAVAARFPITINKAGGGTKPRDKKTIDRPRQIIFGFTFAPDYEAALLGDLSAKSVAQQFGNSAATVEDHRRSIAAGIPDSAPLSLTEIPVGPPQLVAEFKQDDEGNIAVEERTDRKIPLSEWLDNLRDQGFDPDDFIHSHSNSVYEQYTRAGITKTLYANRFTATKRNGAADTPAWPVIQPARDPIIIKPLIPTPRASRFKTAVIGSDTQFGFDMAPDGTLIPYHDNRAVDVFQQIVALEDPEQVVVAGDILDLASMGRWAQEERFAQTTQPALERGRIFAAEVRARSRGRNIWIEGNHDKRMQGFMEANALSAMGLRKAGYPDSWPVMSIPNLLGLDEFGVEYIDAYPAGVHWITDGLRAIHGTRVNSRGSTAAQYANEMPHISTVFGHTHRLEAQSKTTFDRSGKIRTMNINPGCLCRIDGAVPSVKGARHLDGSKATVWEDWQQGVAVIRYLDDGTFFAELVQIDEGRAMHRGEELVSDLAAA